VKAGKSAEQTYFEPVSGDGSSRADASEVEATTRHLLGGPAPARLPGEKDRNQVFAVGDLAIFKAYLTDGIARQARKIAALGFLAGHELPVPRLLGHGVLPQASGGVPWTLESRVVTCHVWPSRTDVDTPQGWELHRALGRWLPSLHASGGFPCFGTWQGNGPTTLAGHVLARARAIRAQAVGLDCVPPALVRRACQGLDRLKPAIRDACWLRQGLARHPGANAALEQGIRGSRPHYWR